jgi:hypothetical protein
MEKRNYGSAKRSYNKKESRKDESTDVRTFGGELKPLMTEVDASQNQGTTEVRNHGLLVVL